MAEADVSKRRRLDQDLYASEGVVVLGAAIFLVGFAVEKHSTTEGRALEAAGFVIFALGLFATAAIAHLLSRHFARTTTEGLPPVAPTPPAAVESTDDERIPLTYFASRVNEAASDPVAPPAKAADADPQIDAPTARLIERERRGAEGAKGERFGDQLFTE
ncbi:MAG: hypothetical protein WA786_06330 [Acidimicrobiales bacterium]